MSGQHENTLQHQLTDGYLTAASSAQIEQLSQNEKGQTLTHRSSYQDSTLPVSIIVPSLTMELGDSAYSDHQQIPTKDLPRPAPILLRRGSPQLSGAYQGLRSDWQDDGSREEGVSFLDMLRD